MTPVNGVTLYVQLEIFVKECRLSHLFLFDLLSPQVINHLVKNEPFDFWEMRFSETQFCVFEHHLHLRGKFLVKCLHLGKEKTFPILCCSHGVYYGIEITRTLSLSEIWNHHLLLLYNNKK